MSCRRPELRRPALSEQPEPLLYQQIKQDLLAAVARGDYRLDQPFITQREVCERYGVSTTTAVRALTDLVTDGVLLRRRGKGTYVAPQREASHREVLQQEVAQGVACIVHGLPGPHVSGIVQGVESVLSERGFRMFLADSDGTAAREARALRQAIATGAAGVILYPVDGEANTDLLEEVRRSGIPLVLVDRYRTDLATDAVVTDDFGLGHRLTAELIARGHRRIGTLWSETRSTSVRDRLTGHQQALREHGLPILPELTTLSSYFPAPEAVRRAALARLFDAAEPPTALLCANAYVVAAVAGDLLSLTGRRRVELAGLDDAGPYDILPLTSVAAALPSRVMGERAAELLLDRVDAGDAYADPQRIVLTAEIRTAARPVAQLQILTH
ncbi:DNA-binding LacI/PurR family transcriptional regulator [Hamadaea flava]|uniref:GntR family transcriptional regulator n=1 Tax=Hamadaea flava TaxID=1742688 RepID=A0ABV8LR98_9ACTN|nr:DNA-binding LacI/PurR family transcriptional regulator [Hamadaea flava]